MVLILNEYDVASSMPPLLNVIDTVEQTFVLEAEERIEKAPKTELHPDHPRSFLHSMPVSIAGGEKLGMKWISYYPENPEGIPDSSATLILNDPETGLPAVIMASMWLTYARTAAMAAVAARHLAPEPVRSLGLVGCGQLGGWCFQALTAVFPDVEEVYVASRTASSRESFCQKVGRWGNWDCIPVSGVKGAVAGRDVVVSTTSQPEQPAVRGEWWEAPTLVVLLDEIRGWDDKSFERVDRLITSDYDALKRAIPEDRPGDLLEGEQDSLAEVVAGKAPARRSSDERIMANLTGISSIDVTVGWDVYQTALEEEKGVQMDFSSWPPLDSYLVD